MANLSNKYLDLAGLEIFWNKANAYIKRHISDEINKIDGTNVLLDNNDADSHSISYEISELWKVIGGGTPGEGSGNLSQDVSTILGAYVKSFKGVDGEYIKIGPSTKSNGPSDIVLTLDETALKQKLSEIEGKSGVTGFQATGSNGINVTGASTPSSGNIVINIDGQELKNYADGKASNAESNANAYTDGMLGDYSDGENTGTGIRGELESIDKRLTQSINSEISARKSKDSLLAGANWDSDNSEWKENSTPKYSNITSLSSVVDEHEGKINLLTSATQFKGVNNSIDVDSDVDYSGYRPGDVIVNGTQEFIADLEVNNGGTGKWILLGDVTAETSALNDIILWINTTRISKGQIQSLFITEPPVTMIQFSIGDILYEAELGMTWGEWVNSSYNTDGYSVHSDNSIGTEGFLEWIGTDSDYVYANESIISNYNYLIVS